MDAERAIILLIPCDSVFEYLTGRRVLANVPADAAMRSMWIDAQYWHTTVLRSRLALRLEHPSFAPVEPGGRIPFVKARFRRLNGEKVGD